MKKSLKLILTSTLLTLSTTLYANSPDYKGESQPPVVEAPFPLTGTFNLTTNYLFRGITQTRNLPAVQGGFTYTFLTTGIYFNIWGSNVYVPMNSTHTSTLEINNSLGIANAINKDMNYDLHIVHYNYPRATALNFNEIIGTLTWRFITGYIAYSNDIFGSGSSGEYYNLGVFHLIPTKYVYFDDVGIGAYYGHSSLPKSAGKTYNDYSVYLNKKVKIYTFTLQWSDTNRRLGQNLDGSKILATMAANF